MPTTPTLEFAPAIPVIRMTSIAAARAFYIDLLGFQIDWEHRFAPTAPLYMQIHRDHMMLHLSEHQGDGAPGCVLFVPMEGIVCFRDELVQRSSNETVPALTQFDWGLQMNMRDPDGNELRFCERNAHRE